jgi:hypothetical protein
MIQLTNREELLIMFCLETLSTNGSYEGGEVRAFDEITKRFGLDVNYCGMYNIEETPYSDLINSIDENSSVKCCK